ncbi:MAG: hypothetical protein Q9207_004146 [Kuettlingeria erythrocarpa]
MHERNVVAQEHEKALTKAQLKDICKACGTVLILDVTSKKELSKPGGARRKRKRREGVPPLQSELPGERLQLKCLACHRVTIVTPVIAPQRQDFGKINRPNEATQRSKDAVTGSELQLDIAKTGAEKPASANASSRKRAKARKQGGLQALLERSKGTQSQSGNPGLDLMDFMKKT